MMNRREVLAGAIAAQAPGAAARPALVKFGKHQVSRLMVGGNPVSGNSHVSGAMSRAMRDYFTAANVKKLLARCEQAGINTWQSRGDRHIVRLLNEYRLEGLIFKVYGASRHCDSPARRFEALRLVFGYAKPDDAVVIGMYPKASEQVEENCRLLAQAAARAS